MGSAVETCSLGRRRQPWQPLRSQHILRQSQKNHTLRRYHWRTELQEHRAGCPGVLALRRKPCSCLAEVGEGCVFLGETFWGELRVLLREVEAPDFLLPPGSLRVGDRLPGLNRVRAEVAGGASWPRMLAALRTLSSCSSSLTLDSGTFPRGEDQRTTGGRGPPHCLVPGECPLRVAPACPGQRQDASWASHGTVFSVMGSACDPPCLESEPSVKVLLGHLGALSKTWAHSSPGTAGGGGGSRGAGLSLRILL